MDWLEAHGAHFSREETLETADLTVIPKNSIMGPVNYRPPKELGCTGLIVDPPKHRTKKARIRVATLTQLKAVEKHLEYGASDTTYEGPNLSEDPRYGNSHGSSQLAKTLADYDCSDPAAARAIVVAGSDFDGMFPGLFWPDTLVYLLPGVGLNQM